MSDAELRALAAQAATALVRLMATDRWPEARAGWAAFAGGGPAADDLDATREELLAARTDGAYGTAQELEVEWRVRLRRRLRADPGAAGELSVLIAGPPPQIPPDTAHNVISGGTQYGTVMQSHDISGDLHISRSTPPGATPPGPPLDDDDDQW